jgi:hypothetical protein
MSAAVVFQWRAVDKLHEKGNGVCAFNWNPSTAKIVRS